MLKHPLSVSSFSPVCTNNHPEHDMILCKALFDTPKHISTLHAKTGVIFSLTFQKDGKRERERLLRGVGGSGGGFLLILSLVFSTHITVYNNIKMYIFICLRGKFNFFSYFTFYFLREKKKNPSNIIFYIISYLLKNYKRKKARFFHNKFVRSRKIVVAYLPFFIQCHSSENVNTQSFLQVLLSKDCCDRDWRRYTDFILKKYYLLLSSLTSYFFIWFWPSP